VPSIQIDVVIGRGMVQTWEELRHIDRHVEWMTDAQRIDFHSEQREGVGTTFDCLTKIGPFAMTDVMTITRWEPPSIMGVVHRGLVGGTGEFVLTDVQGGTHLRWSEDLRFPWWFGAKLGSWLASPVLRRIWRSNLQRFARMVESGDME